MSSLTKIFQDYKVAIVTIYVIITIAAILMATARLVLQDRIKKGIVDRNSVPKEHEFLLSPKAVPVIVSLLFVAIVLLFLTWRLNHNSTTESGFSKSFEKPHSLLSDQYKFRKGLEKSLQGDHKKSQRQYSSESLKHYFAPSTTSHQRSLSGGAVITAKYKSKAPPMLSEFSKQKSK